MVETIGDVNLILDDYPGEDLYSDGAVEDELLEIAQVYDPKDFDRVAAGRKSWPVMYHFSGIRGNILSWYPGLAGKKVLEIGSGCGAVTGVLAEKAKSVTCVELSRKRSLINAHRNKNRGNIEIRLGNFEDVEKKLPRDYDVITLIGVFEYGVNYIHSEHPYEDFLRRVKAHLRDDGVVLIAIENRLGLKYFAGCTEDHTGGFFDGIEGYTNTGYVRTFSRPELEAVAKASGFSGMEFYYPYPDYKFPMSIYSDAYLPKPGELRQNIVNFDRKRLILFDEAKAWDSLAGSGQFPLFSNSFFVVLRKERDESGTGHHTEAEKGEISGVKCQPNSITHMNSSTGTDANEDTESTAKIIYTKYSNERSAALSIRTDILERGGAGKERFVRKVPGCSGAEQHIRDLEKMGRELTTLYAGTRFKPNRVRLEDGAAVFDYLEGETLEEVFDREYGKDPEKLKKAFAGYFAEMDKAAGEHFTSGDGFRKVFGQAASLEGSRAFAISNIDMVLNNILVAEGAWNVIDYEWTFSFPVPVSYIKWRTLHYYIEGNTKRFALRGAGLFEAAGIREEEIPVFEEMELHFQAYIEGEWTPLRELYAEISEGAVDLPALLKRMRGQRGGKAEAKLYPDSGRGFNEDEAVTVPHGEGGEIELQQPLEGLKALRIDPAEYAGYVTVKEIGTELGPIDPATLVTEGVRLDLRRYLFDSEDPYLIVSGWPKEAKYLYASLTYASMDVDSAEFLRKELDQRDRRIAALEKTDRKKEELLSWRGEVIRQMMKTAPMKAYRRLRVAAKRKDPYGMLRPLLPSDPNGILYCIDHSSHRKKEFYLRGWCFDREYASERVYVVNAKDEVIPAEVSRYVRPDVAKTFSLPEERKLGFSVTIPYELVKNPPLYLEVENARGYTCEVLPIEMDEAKREAANRELRAKEGGKHEILNYDDWAHDHQTTEEELLRQRREGPDPELCFSVVVPLFRTEGEWLEALVTSLLDQTYGNFELILSDGSGPDSPLRKLLDRYAGRDGRIHPLHNEKLLRIADNTNAALAAAKGSWIVFADHDDLLTPDALYELAREIHAHPETEMIYSDEDKLLPGGVLGQPNFKPDYSPDFLTSVNYISHLTAVSKELLGRVGPLSGAYEGAQDYDFVLRCSEKTDRIRHIPKVLYHWRWTEGSTAADPAAKDYAFSAGARAVTDHLERIGVRATVTRGRFDGTYRVRERIDGDPLISVIIPNKDHGEDLLRTISSIAAKSSYKKLEWIIVENNSKEQETFSLYEKLKKEYGDLQVLHYEGAFNYSAINNLGAKAAKGDYLLFLNNDTELIAADSLSCMLGVCQRRDVGAVGARLYFEDGSIQHAGVVLGYGGIAGHAFREFGKEESGYQNRICLRQNVSAVTAACMLVRRSVFEEVGGFHEGLAVAFNDIDLCLKIREAGYLIVYEPGAEFFHYESKSRGYEDSPDKQSRFLSEVKVFRTRWQEVLEKGDPYYNPNLTLDRPDFTLRD